MRFFSCNCRILILDGVLADHPVGKDILGLSDTVRTVDRLFAPRQDSTRGRQYIYIVGSGQVQPHSPGLQRYQEYPAAVIPLEALDGPLSLYRRRASRRNIRI